MGRGNKSSVKQSWSHDQDGRYDHTVRVKKKKLFIFLHYQLPFFLGEIVKNFSRKSFIFSRKYLYFSLKF